MTDAERISRHLDVNSRALLMSLGEWVDKDGWQVAHRQSAGFKGLPTSLYNWKPVEEHGYGVLVKLTALGREVKECLRAAGVK